MYISLTVSAYTMSKVFIHCYHCEDRHALNQSQKIVLYRMQKIINALLCKSLPKLMFSKLKHLITFVIFCRFFC